MSHQTITSICELWEVLFPQYDLSYGGQSDLEMELGVSVLYLGEVEGVDMPRIPAFVTLGVVERKCEAGPSENRFSLFRAVLLQECSLMF